jgi:multiple sugar transport system ATP-binding protein
MLYVTHDQIEALTMATRIGVLERGRLVQVGTPQQIYEDPVSSYVAARLGSPRINLMPRALVAEVAAPAQAVTVGVRAEHLRLHRAASGGSHRSAQVTRIERLSDQHLVHVHLNDSEQDLITAAPAGASFDPGEAVRVELLRPLWFDADGRRVAA